MSLSIKIPKNNEETITIQSERLPYHVLVDYAKNFKTKEDIEEELHKINLILQQVEKDKAKHKTYIYSVKLIRYTQLFKTLLAIKASWPQKHIPQYLADELFF